MKDTDATLELGRHEGYDFDIRLPIRRVADFDDEPTLPIGLTQEEIDLPY